MRPAIRRGWTLDPRRSLSARLTLVYAALFALAAALILLGARWGIERYAERAINAEMQAGAKAFGRVTAMRYAQLGDAGRVLASDFGFRAAVATGDAPTIGSALASLKRRFDLEQAFVVDIDGQVTGFDGQLSEGKGDRLLGALDGGVDRGVLRSGGRVYNAAAAPIETPMLLGWVVFAKEIDAAEMRELGRLTSMDLHPAIVPVADLPAGTTLDARDAKVIARDGERILLRASPVPVFGGRTPLALTLEYSLTAALAGYQPMLWSLLGFGLLGVAIAALGSHVVAQRITRPIKALDAAARRVSAGESAQVPVETRDELGRLAGSFNRMVVAIEDREQRIAHMAFHDSLTGLANRALLREHVARLLARGQGFALLCLDLDNFKVVNDTLGHPTGDALLCEIARRLQAACPDAFIARLGGDEFALVAEESARTPDRLGRDLLAAISAPATVNGHRVVPGTSIGIAIAPHDGANATDLQKNADLALYRAKREGKGGLRFFESAMDEEAQKRRQMELDLHDAMREGQLFLMFQPLFDLGKGRVSAFEALMRWQHPERGLISPVDFIPLAEDTGLIVPMGAWAIREACRAARQWPDHVRVAVNVSAVQFRNPGLNTVVMQALAESGLAPDRLELEITESLFIDNVEGVLASLHSLRALGVRVALDDFGTGYSSLSYLRSFPFDKIKIDRSFIIDLLSSDGATAIIKSITTLADALGMETTAEGVENVGQLDILREQGCSHIQGFYFSRPLPEGAIAELFAEERARAAA
ncbi:putative bifunctional diguanylate cyclase/phosphodiesterase [Sphingomonas baiyangensis]|uniref:EAL domain-containing protein n=1 Tax=Sphingomonas baiyangensis TaxID=2572576 RepID=A0A4U1LAA5_9SPHN|nr:EAL domain-containing protein [Sphingomonas baiyangensis]TKD53286.1 EAL domain-containing protein [Sphingomonas baiyangensis]